MPRVGASFSAAAVLAILCATPALAQTVPPADTTTSATVFRLGTAASPFAWSTAVGDLNADGRPDFAIADRLGRGVTGVAYAIELAISGDASRLVTFDADASAVTVSLRDIDHDRDLDIVVSALFSHAIVRIWLNDGRGGFREATSWTRTREDPGDPYIDVEYRSAEAATPSLPRRTILGDRDASLWRISDTPASSVAAPASHLASRLEPARLSSRAPPLVRSLLS